MASDSSPANGISSPEEFSTSPISNTRSSPGNPRRPKRTRNSGFASPSPSPLAGSRFRPPDATTPLSGTYLRPRVPGTPNDAPTPSSADDVPVSSDAGDMDEEEAPP
ncbi:hypothetical protein M569_06961, partial [Genlisea aurea]